MYNVCVVLFSFCCVPETSKGRELKKWTKEKEKRSIKLTRNSTKLKKIKSGVSKHEILREFEISGYYPLTDREYVLLLTLCRNWSFYYYFSCFNWFYHFSSFFYLKKWWILYRHTTLGTALFVYHLTFKWPYPISGTRPRAIPLSSAPV